MEQGMMRGPFTMLPKDKIDSFRPQVEKFVGLHYFILALFIELDWKIM
jgi:hypothetical protein